MTTTTTSQKVGGVLCILIGLFLAGPSAAGKFIEWEGKAQMFEKIGMTSELVTKIGVLEIILAIIFVIPRTRFLGAILLTGYLGGAVMTHLRINESIVFPIIIGVVMWIAVGMREPDVFRLAFNARRRPQPDA